MLSREQLRARIIKRLRKMKREFEQLVRDQQWWNKNRTDAPPFDIGFDLSMLQCINKALDAWERNEPQAANVWHERMERMSSDQAKN